jgi:hypothetical protein
MLNRNMPKQPQTHTAAIPITVGKIQERFGPVNTACQGPGRQKKRMRDCKTFEQRVLCQCDSQQQQESRPLPSVEKDLV